ncbi:MAG: hypothetical protein A2054_08185 [Deltaproteobacteria bacterium GWA2_55_10]|nr:MAG: hypothetical protein A2054_08185 [Deltaproteobacteria bacterium GWA2_55_10]
MFKVERTAAAQGFQSIERPKAKEPDTEARKTDTVHISEEGKRKHVFGHIMASISETGKKE